MLGFRECLFDMCLFHQPGMLTILCADNTGMAAPDEESTVNLVKELWDGGFDLEMEGDFTKCPGIGMEERDSGMICMCQKGPIKTAEMKECDPSKTPAPTTAPGMDAQGKPCNQKHWDCASVVRMLLCVSNNTRPDVTFVASQAAQHTACPKESHARSVNCVVCCLAGMADKGLVVKCDGTFDLKACCWADADFAGTSGQEPSGNAEAAELRCRCA